MDEVAGLILIFTLFHLYVNKVISSVFIVLSLIIRAVFFLIDADLVKINFLLLSVILNDCLERHIFFSKFFILTDSESFKNLAVEYFFDILIFFKNFTEVLV